MLERPFDLIVERPLAEPDGRRTARHDLIGESTDFGVERIYRAVRGVKIYEGTSDIQRLIISREIAKD